MYVKEVLKPKRLPPARSLLGEGEHFVFQQDGAPCHTVHLSMKWNKEEH